MNKMKLFFMLAPFLYGGFHEWVSCLYSLALIGILLWGAQREGGLRLQKHLTFFAVLTLACFYGVSAFWAVDRGMAIVGFFKFLPLPLFALALMQIGAQERREILDAAPISGGVMVALSLVLWLIPACRDALYVNGRMGGFFQYPNTFALFLLVGLILLAGREKWKLAEWLCLPLLLAGIALSGSRTVFFLTAAVVFALCFFLKGKKRWALCLLLAAMVAGTSLYVALTGNVAGIGRYLTSSLGSSTFLGRFLYYKDVLPVVLKHPFGLGYLGYYYQQGSFQTGVYTVQHVHNDFLQILVDVGWIPAALFVAALVLGFLRRKGFIDRLLLAAIVAHCMFDFDLQFVSLWFLLLLALDWEGGKGRMLGKKMLWRTAGAVAASLCLWQGIALGLYRFGKNEAAVKVYPGCTGAWISLLSQAGDAEEMERVADEILSRNQSVSLAYSAKARAAYANGDFERMIAYKRQAIAHAKYEMEEYLDYFDMLYVGIQLYLKNGDVESAEFCRQRLMEIPDMLQEVSDGTDELAWKIRDKPDLALPEEYQGILTEVSDRGAGF